MKKLLIILLCLPLLSLAQKTYVPDDNFEQALINFGYDNLLDDSVLTANVSSITSLNLSGLNINNLIGIESMISLTQLDCDNNNLTNLDVSSLTLLNWFMCYENQINYINVSNLIALGDFDCSNNLIDSLDVSNNINLIALDCFDNQLTYLDVSNGNNVNMDFNCFNNLNLYNICSDDSVWATNNWTVTMGNIDPQHYFSSNCGPASTSQKTYVPDDNFELYIESQGWGDGIMNDSVMTQSIMMVTQLWMINLSINDLTGIQNFINLDQLYANNNNISSIDLSNLQYLKSLNLSYNNLTSIDLSNNPLLDHIWLGDNQIGTIDLSNHSDLYFLNIDDGIVSQLTLYSPSSILREVHMYSNNISSFDATQFPALIDLDISKNEISTIDLSQNYNLESLWIGSNPNLSHLDVSSNSNLEKINLVQNFLYTLDMRNGNNYNITSFATWGCFNSPFLQCISVDDSSYSANNWIDIDSWQYFSDNCNLSTSISELENDEKELLRIVNILSKEVAFLEKEQIYFYIYNDGTVEKRIVVE